MSAAKAQQKTKTAREVKKAGSPTTGVSVANVEIEDNIPAPAAIQRLSWPWDRMRAGQSFFVACATEDDAKTMAVRIKASGRNYFNALREEGGGSFRTLAEVREEGGRVGVRAWKVAR